MPPKASKRARTESSRKREGRENEEVLKREREAKKATSKARKTRRDEAKEDDLLVEREGDSPDMKQLRVYTLKLESDYLRMSNELRDVKDRKQKAPKQPSKMIPAPPNQSDIDVELLRTYLNLLGEEHDFEWLGYRNDTRQCIYAGRLARRKRWAKQTIECQNTVIQALENRRPKLKRLEGNWGAIFLLKQCQDNAVNYQLKQDAIASPRAPDTPASDDDSAPDADSDKASRHKNSTNLNSAADEDDKATAAHKLTLRKAALQRCVERKAAKLKARATLEAELAEESGASSPDEKTPSNGDSDTELEELPDPLRKTIEREEIGVPADSQTPLKAVPKKKRAFTDEDGDAQKVDNPTTKKLATVNKKSGSDGKRRPIIYMKRGGGKSMGVGRGSQAHVGTSQSVVTDPEDDELSSSSGQTSSDTDDDE